MEHLTAELTRLGHRVSVISTVPHYADRESGRQSGGWWPRWTVENGARVLRVRVPSVGKRESAPARLLNYVVFNSWSFAASLCSGAQDLVFTLSPPLTGGLVTALAGWLRGIPSIYNVQDLVPEAYVQFGVIKNPHVIRAFERIEAAVYRRNTHITVISESFRDHLLAKRVPAEKIDVVPNFVDLDEIRPLPRENALSTRLALDGRFVVMHAGSVAYRHGVEVLVEAAGLLTDLPDVLFLFVGGGTMWESLERSARASGLDNVRLLPYQPRADLPLLRACADVQAIVLRRGMTSHSVPSKVYEIMASRRPFVAAVDARSTIWHLADQGYGVAVEPESAAQIAAAVRRLHADRPGGAAMAARARAYVEANCSRQAVGARYDELFRRLAVRTEA
jgi:colanic acid biosynthesis glycosyl transferase WcaI